MKQNHRNIAASLAVLTAMAPFGTAFAQTKTAPAKKPNLIQKHPTATGFAAGVATHAALKHSAAKKKAMHQKLNFAEKHPTITGIAAGLATRAAIKKTTPSPAPKH